MIKLCAAVIVGMFISGLATHVSAQANAAVAQAKARLACGTGTVVSSQFLPNGTLQVTCSQPQPGAESTVLQGTGLAAPAALGALGLVVVLVVATGGSDPAATSTTTTGSQP